MCLSSQIRPEWADNWGSLAEAYVHWHLWSLVRITPAHGLGTLPLPESGCRCPLRL